MRYKILAFAAALCLNVSLCYALNLLTPALLEAIYERPVMSAETHRTACDCYSFQEEPISNRFEYLTAFDESTGEASAVDRKAEITFMPRAGYTSQAERNNTAGTVKIGVILSASGKVKNVKILQGLPDGLNKEALTAARRIKFEPAMRANRKLSQYLLLEYRYDF